MKRLHAILPVLVVLSFSAAGWSQTLDEAIKAQTDVWGEAALREPGGPSYKFFAKLLPPLRYVDASFHHYPITLSAPSNPTKARLVSNGSCVNALARQPNYINEAGRPITFFVGDGREIFGSNLAQLDGPKYADGYLPIVQLTYRSAGATYSEEAFASTDPQLADYGVVLVKLTLVKASGRNYQVKEAVDKDPASTMPVAGVEAAENVLLTTKPFDEKVEALIEGPELYALKDNKIRSGNFKDYNEASDPKNAGNSKIVAMTYPRWIFNPGRGALIARLKTGES